MSNWKRALVFGSLGAGIFLLISGRRPAGVLATTVGLVTLASEHPEKFREAWERAPEFLDRGNQVVDIINRIAERFNEYRAQKTGWREAIADQ